jgi:hypothetical protein
VPQGPFCSRDVSLQNFWDKKSLYRFVQGRFRQGTTAYIGDSDTVLVKQTLAVHELRHAIPVCHDENINLNPSYTSSKIRRICDTDFSFMDVLHYGP